MGLSRRWYLVLGAACALVAAGLAAVVIVVVFPGESEAAPTKAQYLARVAAICRVYGPQLDRVAPPTDIAVPGEVASSVEKALPILEAESSAVRSLRSPEELKAQLAGWHALNER